MKEAPSNTANIQLRLLSYGVIMYMLMAFAWWSILLFTKNKDAFEAKRDLLKLGMIAQGIVHSDEDFLQSDRYQLLAIQYHRQEWMIFGEAFVFIISLVIGVWLINRGYNKEMMAARQRRNFLLSITHELKSPLASIRLVLETFLKRELQNDQIQTFSKKGLKETERLTSLVNDLLLSAKLETAYQPHLESIDLVQLFEGLVQQMRDNHPHATFGLNSLPAPLMVFADQTGITSVGLNLLENAVKYAGPHPKIQIDISCNNSDALITVADNGPGIEDKEKKLIFDKFYRVGNEETRQTKGTGLGLFIANQIVKAHQGSITVSDHAPGGTIFSVRLPVKAQEQAINIKQDD